jgi:cellobiose phosphorylase
VNTHLWDGRWFGRGITGDGVVFGVGKDKEGRIYYRGAYYQHPRTAGRSSQLFNTGTVSWVYRCLVEGLFGSKAADRAWSFNRSGPANGNGPK